MFINALRQPAVCTIACFFALTAVGCGQVVTSTNQAESPDRPQTEQDVREDNPGTEPLAVGQPSPDFEVEILGGKTVRLSDYFGERKGPTVLLFDRAHW